ncbi:hypothetical protein I7I51_07624 [Histoplasma capsulatum]|uniref:Uncharacterized protein n=1 Tax=Ajellomyces capsulatus TaxID=5037 RepID=A0A8A1LWP4_AJECA|nr:hypothetical protein I7I51_07624 [Histoplasma capsulatum]
MHPQPQTDRFTLRSAASAKDLSEKRKTDYSVRRRHMQVSRSSFRGAGVSRTSTPEAGKTSVRRRLRDMQRAGSVHNDMRHDDDSPDYAKGDGGVGHTCKRGRVGGGIQALLFNGRSLANHRINTDSSPGTEAQHCRYETGGVTRRLCEVCADADGLVVYGVHVSNQQSRLSK